VKASHIDSLKHPIHICSTIHSTASSTCIMTPLHSTIHSPTYARTQQIRYGNIMQMTHKSKTCQFKYYNCSFSFCKQPGPSFSRCEK